MKNRSIFKVLPEGLFFGRAALIEKICRSATDLAHPPCGIILQGGRWTGKTEVLRRAHRNLFWEQGHVVPVYYQFREMSRLDEFAGDFIKEVIKQFLAFKRRDPRLALAQLTLKKIRLLLSDEGLTEVADLITTHLEAKAGGEPMAIVRNALRAPDVISRLTASPAFLLLDDMGLSTAISLYDGGPGLMREIASVVKTGSFIASTGAGVTQQELAGEVYSETIELDGLDGHEARAMIEELARGYGLSSEAEVVSTAARRLGGNPFYIGEFLRAASCGHDEALKTLKGFASLYVSEITSGALGAALGGEFSSCGHLGLRVLRSAMRARQPLGLEDLAETLGVSRAELESPALGLESLDLIKINLGSIVSTSDPVVRDYIEYMCSTGLLGKSPAETRTWMIRDVVKKGFSGQGKVDKDRFLREVMHVLEAFDGQDAPEALFRAGAKADDGRAEKTLMALPSVTGSFSASAFEKFESGLPVVIAHGFAPGRFDASGEVLWLVGLKGSHAPVNTGDVENFLRRSRILQREFCPARVIRWMVGREGFTAEAIERLSKEGGGVFTTDASGLAALKKLSRPVESKSADEAEPQVREFEMVLPSSRNAELVGVRAAGEISAGMGFDEDSIGRIKTSVVEACINAFEHSGSPSARVHLRFVAAPDMLTIYVSNPGRDFGGLFVESASAGATGNGLPHKRGWGLELMRGLMDEVRYESLDGGTRLVLVKYLKKKGDEGDGRGS